MHTYVLKYECTAHLSHMAWDFRCNWSVVLADSMYISASFRGFRQSFTAILSEHKPCFVSYYDLNSELKANSLCKPN
jgi:hypothetical protein